MALDPDILAEFRKWAANLAAAGSADAKTALLLLAEYDALAARYAAAVAERVILRAELNGHRTRAGALSEQLQATAAERDLLRAEAATAADEVSRLRRLVESLSERVHKQSELLSRKAGKDQEA